MLERRILRRSTRIIVGSAGVRELCVRRGLSADRLQVIPPGVPPVEPPRVTRHQVFAELGIPPQHHVLGIVGPLRLAKRIKDAIWAADLLKVIRDDVHLLVIGDGPHRARLRMFRDQVRIADKVHFLGDRADLSRLLPHLDVFWSISSQQGQGNTILEAMAAGVPVVASDLPVNRELVVDQTTGYLVPVGDRAAVTRCTNRLLDDAALARRLGEAGRQRATEHFHATQMIQEHVALYRTLLA
jgi:glycosyltransferase involved in cell wall biosynthesis